MAAYNGDNNKLTVEYSTKELFEKIDTLGEKLFVAIDHLDTKFDHAINGNGTEGLKTRQTRIEQTLKIYNKIFFAIAIPVIVLLIKEAILLIGSVI